MGAKDSLFAVTHYPLFSLTLRAQRKKLAKKKRIEEISPLASGDKGSAPLTARTFEKVRSKLFGGVCANIVRNKPQFITRQNKTAPISRSSSLF